MAQTKTQNDPWTPLPECNGRLPQPPCDPRHQLIDSDRYIESLERRLKRLKGRNKPEPSSRDIIDSLAGFKDDQMRRFLSNSNNGHQQQPCIPEADDLASSANSGSYLQRRLHPERQALNMEELFELLKDDELTRIRHEETEEEEDNKEPVRGNSSQTVALAGSENVSDSCGGENQTRVEDTLQNADKHQNLQTDSGGVSNTEQHGDMPENSTENEVEAVKDSSA